MDGNELAAQFIRDTRWSGLPDAVQHKVKMCLVDIIAAIVGGVMTPISDILEINEETLALDVIHEHALSGDFLGSEHTVRHVREDWQPRLVDRHNYEQWMASGGMSMRERARAKIDEILSAEHRHILPPDIEKRIRTIAERTVVAQAK